MNNWYSFYKTAQYGDVLYINANEAKQLTDLGFLPQIPSSYQGFYYLLPISQLNEDQKNAWKYQLEQVEGVSGNLYNKISQALNSNKDLSIIGTVRGGPATKQHEEFHHQFQQSPVAQRLQMQFRSRDPEEVREITKWLTQHGYGHEEAPEEYYAYILTQPELMQNERFKLTEDEFNTLRSMGVQVPEEAKKNL